MHQEMELCPGEMEQRIWTWEEQNQKWAQEGKPPARQDRTCNTVSGRDSESSYVHGHLIRLRESLQGDAAAIFQRGHSGLLQD